MGKLYENINISMVRLLVRDTYENLQHFVVTEDYKNLPEDKKRIIENSFWDMQKAHSAEWHINTF